MAKPKGLIVEEDIVAQEFDLEEILGVDLSQDETLAAEIGQDIVNYIRERAADNKGIGGKALRSPYSKEYQASEEFKRQGKSSKDVNMKLTGDMLDAVDVLDFDGTTLVVGIDNDQAPKAHGHMTGKNGEVPNMKREWFGLTQSELKSITDNYSDRVKELEAPAQRVEDFLTPQETQAVDIFFRNVGDLFSFEEES